jgi:hypothetical protein
MPVVLCSVPSRYMLRKTLHPLLGYRLQQFTLVASVIHGYMYSYKRDTVDTSML